MADDENELVKVEVIYGTIGVEGDIINVNMPGGTLQGEKAQERYLFLMRESETSFAVVGEYCGEIILENGVVNWWLILTQTFKYSRSVATLVR